MSPPADALIPLAFLKSKENALDGVDYSRKGSFDAPISNLIQKLNNIPQYFTTSSCSGRIIIAGHDADSTHKKKGCKWLYVTHGMADVSEVLKTVTAEDLSGDYVFKFEPFILHVQCANLEAARELLQTAVASGYRNSGISVGKRGKTITAIRSTANLEVPVVSNGKVLVTTEYFEYLVNLANRKMNDNFERIKLFQSVLIFNSMNLEEGKSKSKTLASKPENDIDNKQNEGTNSSVQQNRRSGDIHEHTANYDLSADSENMLTDIFGL